MIVSGKVWLVIVVGVVFVVVLVVSVFVVFWLLIEVVILSGFIGVFFVVKDRVIFGVYVCFVVILGFGLFMFYDV